ncbi:hypothetical protein ACOMHN_001786 [Nucella lapillus]
MSEDGASQTKKMRESTEKSPEEQEKEWREVFNIFDMDHSGNVSSSELGILLRGLGYNPTQTQLEDMLHHIDTNNTGLIEWDEFTVFMGSLNLAPAQEQKKDMLCAFQIFDYNGDGLIDAKELKRVMTTTGEKLSDEEVDQMISVADIDKDGRINYIEFVNFIFSERA